MCGEGKSWTQREVEALEAQVVTLKQIAIYLDRISSELKYMNGV